MFVTNWISTTKIQKISEITNFFRHYFLSRTEVVMITYRLETSCLMTSFQLLYREILIHSRCTAMKYNQRNISLVFTHNFIVFCFKC